MTAAPKVSIVIVNRNMAQEIAGTLESVLAQDCPDFESIVIDGASTDGSREVIASYAPRLAYWVSEADRNLYDAMNKGVVAAKGEWIIFMNAGDSFAGRDILSRVFSGDVADFDILYGHHIRVYSREKIERLIPAEGPEVLPLRMPCSHQSLFMRRQILALRPFDIALLAADYDALLAAYVAGKRFKQIDCVVARMEAGGRSDRYRLKSLRQRVLIVRRHGLMTAGVAAHYGLLMARAVAAAAAKAVLPKSIIAKILRHRPIKGLG